VKSKGEHLNCPETLRRLQHSGGVRRTKKTAVSVSVTNCHVVSAKEEKTKQEKYAIDFGKVFIAHLSA
jgi:hypothetical protein